MSALAFTAQQKLQKENEAIGFYLSGHPLDPMQPSLTENGVITWKQIAAGAVSGTQPIKMAGIPIGKRIMTTQKGARIAFLSLSDTSGNYEVTLFQEAFESYRDFLDSNEPLLLTIEVKIRNGEENARRLLVKSLTKFEGCVGKNSRGGADTHQEAHAVQNLHAMISQHGKSGKGGLFFLLSMPNGILSKSNWRIPSPLTMVFRQAMKSVEGGNGRNCAVINV